MNGGGGYEVEDDRLRAREGGGGDRGRSHMFHAEKSAIVCRKTVEKLNWQPALFLGPFAVLHMLLGCSHGRFWDAYLPTLAV